MISTQRSEVLIEMVLPIDQFLNPTRDINLTSINFFKAIMSCDLNSELCMRSTVTPTFPSPVIVKSMGAPLIRP